MPERSLHVRIDMGRWSMLLPQEDVVSVELLSEAICTVRKGELFWWYKWQGEKVEVLALNEEALPVDVEEVQGNALVLLGRAGRATMALACNSLEVIPASNLQYSTKLPTVMGQALNLFDELVICEESLVCVSSLEKLEAYMRETHHE